MTLGSDGIFKEISFVPKYTLDCHWSFGIRTAWMSDSLKAHWVIKICFWSGLLSEWDQLCRATHVALDMRKLPGRKNRIYVSQICPSHYLFGGPSYNVNPWVPPSPVLPSEKLGGDFSSLEFETVRTCLAVTAFCSSQHGSKVKILLWGSSLPPGGCGNWKWGREILGVNVLPFSVLLPAGPWSWPG